MRTYSIIYAALLGLTALTVGASAVNAGRVAATAMALALASVKGFLIAWYFMHMKSERPLVWVVMGVGLAAVFILVIGVLPDLAWKLK